ncbi:hypothetical protein CVT24_007897 [Panaeolus cyanescens]|uniref:Post-GPI attachment to proteins factor 3 n=1 Tax=Panaeolus cyanescens TaxID=181874 RepID=A0A409VZM8_9AGAR|nr:hypothetical protein CVT24_007897 [Panaeolus cyanescens]
MTRIAFAILAVFALVHFSIASSGDRAFEFNQCITRCNLQKCLDGQVELSPALRLTQWTCLDDCKYKCMHEITDKAVELGERVHQYYGKWPFWRFAGMQEPASVLFSLFNLWAHAKGAAKLRRRVSVFHPMRHYYLVWSWLSINAWVWSSVFHTRDLPLTEKLDYFSAALAIIYALYFTLIRLFRLYPTSGRTRLTLSTRSSDSIARRILSIVITLIYLGHVSYLSLLPRFDYTYNMAFNLTIGMSHNILWLLYSLPFAIFRRFSSQPRSYRPGFVYKAGVFVLLTTCATALELFDFPAWRRIIDAHSLWHLATAPIALCWYDFLAEDSLDPSWRDQKS